MANFTCLAQDDPARLYQHCPSIEAAILFALLFTFTTLINTIQSISLRFKPAWIIIMAGTWELAGYISRSISISQQTNAGLVTAQFLLILLAPLWINAFVYMVFGHMVHFFLLDDDRVFGIRARHITMMFVLFDITAFVVQLVGGLMTSGTDVPLHTVQLGLHIYTGGVALQLAFIATFVCLTLQFRWLLKRIDGLQEASRDRTCADSSSSGAGSPFIESNASTEPSKDTPTHERTYNTARPILRALWIALSVIVLRNIYRLVEYALGGAEGNTMTRHEWYQYVFDAVPMLFAMLVLSVWHPGKVLRGYRSGFGEEDKRRKEAKRARKLERIEVKRGAKELKKAGRMGRTNKMGEKVAVVDGEVV